MSTTEIAVHRPQPQPGTIPAKLAYARELANSGLLPASYRKNPANVLWAAEFAEMLGLHPLAAMTGVHVIEGKPTASAGLISALVRRAGHKLRVTGDAKSATCQIVRADDPSYTFTVTFTMDDARTAGLTGKEVWKKYGPPMLKARAITQCARDACEEALFGLHYTPEELGAEVDEDGVVLGTEAVDEHTWENAAPAAEAEHPDGNGTRQRWIIDARKRAKTFKSESEGTALWREAGQAHLDGRATRKEMDEVQNAVNARIAGRRQDAAAQILKPLPEDDPWRDKVLEELSTDDDAREAITELQDLSATSQMDVDRARLIARAVIARFPKAAVTEGGSDG